GGRSDSLLGHPDRTLSLATPATNGSDPASMNAGNKVSPPQFAHSHDPRHGVTVPLPPHPGDTGVQVVKDPKSAKVVRAPPHQVPVAVAVPQPRWMLHVSE